jgi:tRNA threonylcarbamoyl adenosine modification protein YeaZ
MSIAALEPPPRDGILLALDTGSPIVSVAVGTPPRVFAHRRIAQAGSSERLMAMIDEVLTTAGLERAEIAGVVALRGPGSFTGLRIGMATALGLHQALTIPATTLPTLEALAATVALPGVPVLAVVDALRGEWSAQPFLAGRPPTALSGPAIEAATDLPRHAPRAVVGFGLSSLAAAPWPDETELLEPESLAPAILRHLADRTIGWESAALLHPLYLRPPAARPSAGR